MKVMHCSIAIALHVSFSISRIGQFNKESNFDILIKNDWYSYRSRSHWFLSRTTLPTMRIKKQSKDNEDARIFYTSLSTEKIVNIIFIWISLITPEARFRPLPKPSMKRRYEKGCINPLLQFHCHHAPFLIGQTRPPMASYGSVLTSHGLLKSRENGTTWVITPGLMLHEVSWGSGNGGSRGWLLGVCIPRITSNIAAPRMW